MAKVAIYYRVSTPDRQVRELRRYARKRKFKVQGEYLDEVSGATRSRPELDRMACYIHFPRATRPIPARITAAIPRTIKGVTL